MLALWGEEGIIKINKGLRANKKASNKRKKRWTLISTRPSKPNQENIKWNKTKICKVNS